MAALLVVLTGCGGADRETARFQLDEAGARSALVRFADGLAQGRFADACANLSLRATRPTGLARSCADDLRAMTASLSRQDLLRLQKQVRSVKITVRPHNIRAAVAPVPGPIAPRGLGRQAGRWRVDFEVPVRAADGVEPTEQTARAWPAKWCRVKPGMTSTAAQRVMGAPSLRLPGELQWGFREYGFTAFVNARGRIVRLQADTTDLSQGQRAAISCAPMRRS